MNTEENNVTSPRDTTLWRRVLARWQQRDDETSQKFTAIQRQFLPAALSVQKTPPSPAAHWVLGLLLALFSVGVLWACLGEVDIVVSAPGRIVPSGQVKIVQAIEAGTVAAIYVKDGQRVELGQRLLKLDPTYADADISRIHQRLFGLDLQLLWRGALDTWLASGRTVSASLKFPAKATAAQRMRTTTLYQQQQLETTAGLAASHSELSENSAEQRALGAELDKNRATLAVLEQRVTAYKLLMDKQYGARIQYLEILQRQTELALSLPVLQWRLQQLEAAADAIAARTREIEGELRKSNLIELSRLDIERASLGQELLKARQRLHQQLVAAPVTGTVQELALHTVGGVVTPAQVLMKIVPENVVVEVEALLKNKDIGFVYEGQLAEVKINTFNFTKYGLIDAMTTDISNDAIEDKKLGWVFKMRLELKQDHIAVEEKWIKLSPGMAVTVEIKTGTRRLIEFFMSPLLRYRHESVRER